VLSITFFIPSILHISFSNQSSSYDFTFNGNPSSLRELC
jgi:hypothetical protein